MEKGFAENLSLHGVGNRMKQLMKTYKLQFVIRQPNNPLLLYDLHELRVMLEIASPSVIAVQ